MQSESLNRLHIFDCDGVLLDSNAMKIKAMRETLESLECPSVFVDWAVESFRQNFGRTRMQHFRNFGDDKGGRGFCLSVDMIATAMDYYGERVVSAYQDCEVISETYDYISQLSGLESVWVVSASDQKELRSILPKKFPLIKEKYILGGPVSKIDNIKSVLNIAGNVPCSFYGDAVQDAKAAMATGIEFTGLTKYAADSEALQVFCNKNNLMVYSHCYEAIG